MTGIPTFNRYVGIDYSGAQTPTSSLKGLRVYMADRATPPSEVEPPPSPRKYWTRRGIAEWLGERLLEDRPTLVGIDHGFSLSSFSGFQSPMSKVWETTRVPGFRSCHSLGLSLRLSDVKRDRVTTDAS